MKGLTRQPDAVRRAAVGPGEKVLAGVVAGDGTVLVGTRDALYVGDRRIPWETVERADWESEDRTLTITEVGSWGERRPVHTVVVDEPLTWVFEFEEGVDPDDPIVRAAAEEALASARDEVGLG